MAAAVVAAVAAVAEVVAVDSEAVAACFQDDYHFSSTVAAASGAVGALEDVVGVAAAVDYNAFAAADACHTVLHPVLAEANHSSLVQI